jgi:DNA-binding transcriptional ArsR family regulator
MSQAASRMTANPRSEGSYDAAAQAIGGAAISAFTGDTIAAPAASARLVEMMCTLRKDRFEHFPGLLGTDACWDILLTLYAGHLNQHRLNISKLNERTKVPPTTVLRSITTLAEARLVIRTKDRFDGRRILVELSPSGVAAMNRYFLRTGVRAVLL